MTDSAPTIFLSAAEASGDHHAGALIRAMKLRMPDARFVGVAGPQMVEAGCESLVDLVSQATMITGPLTRIGYYVRTVRDLQRQIRRMRPHMFIPVDSPALNWHLAAAARKAGALVMHYVCPQIWAWAPWRIGKLRRLTDHVACLMPFEAQYLQHRNVPATFVGHPLFDNLPPRPDPLPDPVGAWSQQNWTIAMLPGSREGEIRTHTPALLATAALVRRRYPDATCLFLAGDVRAADAIRTVADRKDQSVEIVVARTSDTLARSHFAVAVSGTVTLQVAYYGVPMVVFYKVPKFNWELVGRWLIRAPHLSLVNILSPTGRSIVPELMPWHGNIKRVQAMVMEVLEDLGGMVETQKTLLQTVQPLRAPAGTTAADNAAELAVQLLQTRRRPIAF